MGETTRTARVAWTFGWDGSSDTVKIQGRDSVTQSDYLLEAPLHTLPGLRELLDDVVDAHPELFPAEIHTRKH